MPFSAERAPRRKTRLLWIAESHYQSGAGHQGRQHISPVPFVTITTFQAYETLHFAVNAYETSNNESAFAVATAVAPKLLPMFW
jgi:hypothetical protein